MEKQLIFREKYLFKLKSEINVDKYKSKEFIFEENQTLLMPSVIKPNGLLSLLDYKNDFITAVKIYESYINLQPIQASDERLWTYLTHVDLYPYMIVRWNGVINQNSSDPLKYIKDHWFLESTVQNCLLRHPLAGLWWSVFLSVDEKRGDDKYELTTILFRQLDFPTRTLGTYKLGRHKEAVIGILEFIQENEDLFKNHFENKTRFITKHLNLIGGIKPISYFDRNYFKEELQKIHKSIREI